VNPMKLMRMLRMSHKRTPHTGMSDSVPALINGSQPAALSNDEYVIDAQTVAMIGDGSSEAGAKILDDLVKQIRTMKQGHSKQAAPLGDLIRKTVKKAKKGG
jgi:hypothetical protein